MPITKSAKKSLKVSRTKQAQNRLQSVKLEKSLRLVNEESVNEVVSLIDKAAKTNLIHKNKAARLKSKLAKKMATPKTENKTAVAKPVKKTATKKVATKSKAGKKTVKSKSK